MEGMSRVIIEVGVAIGYGSRDLLTHPQRSENVVFTTDNQAGLNDIDKLIVYIVVDTSRSLTFKSMQRLRGWTIGESVASFEQARVSLVIVPERLCENKKLYPLHELGG